MTEKRYFNFQLPQDLFEELDAEAEDRMISKSAIARQAVKKEVT